MQSGIDHDEYRNVIHSIFSVFFMARNGSALANVYTDSMRHAGLRIEPYLRTSRLGSNELAKINTRFKNLPQMPQINSFYETLQTGVWLLLQVRLLFISPAVGTDLD